jgi:hypothetical protein
MDHPSTPPQPRTAVTLSRSRLTNSRLTLALGASVLLNIATPFYYANRADKLQKVAILDLASGTLIVSPLVHPVHSKEIIDIDSEWAALCLLDRSEVGPDHPEMLALLFDRPTAKKAGDEFESLKEQYVQKKLSTHAKVKSIDSQRVHISTNVGDAIKARVVCQVDITGHLYGEKVEEPPQTVTVDFTFVRNPDLGRNQRYSLMVIDYQYPSKEMLTKK